MTTRILLFAALTFSSSSLFAQQKSRDTFVAQSKVIFYDDFSKVEPGRFPKKWVLGKCSGGPFLQTIALYKVQAEDSINVLTTEAENQPFVEPNLEYIQSYLGDDFTVEYDFAFTPIEGKVRHCMHFLFDGSANCEQALFRIENRENGRAIFAYETHYPLKKRKQEGNLPPAFDPRKWHHFALSFKKRQIKCYLDGDHILTVDTCGYSPARIALHGGFSPIKYKNVKIAKAPRTNPADSILSGKPFVSHAVSFDVNEFVIKPESNAFLQDMVQFLSQHGNVSIEISGHTDNSGETDSNMALSFNRANAVRDYLISNRIDSARLIAKGYGDTHPIQTNNTPVGREQNRRVEFQKVNR